MDVRHDRGKNDFRFNGDFKLQSWNSVFQNPVNGNVSPFDVIGQIKCREGQNNIIYQFTDLPELHQGLKDHNLHVA